MTTLIFPLVICIAAAIYYQIVVRKRMSPEAQAAAFAAAGFRPGEALRGSFAANVLARDASGGLMESAVELQRAGYTTMVVANLTTHDRLHIKLDGVDRWFEGNQRPRIRVLGRIMMKDSTGLTDAVLLNQTRTTLFFVEEGQPAPPGAAPRSTYNMQSQMEPTCVIELWLPEHPPLWLDLVESGARGLAHWARSSPQAYAPAPYGNGAPSVGF